MTKYDNRRLDLRFCLEFDLKSPDTGPAARPRFGMAPELCLRIRRMYIWRGPEVAEGRWRVLKIG